MSVPGPIAPVYGSLGCFRLAPLSGQYQDRPLVSGPRVKCSAPCTGSFQTTARRQYLGHLTDNVRLLEGAISRYRQTSLEGLQCFRFLANSSTRFFPPRYRAPSAKHFWSPATTASRRSLPPNCGLPSIAAMRCSRDAEKGWGGHRSSDGRRCVAIFPSSCRADVSRTHKRRHTIPSR